MKRGRRKRKGRTLKRLWFVASLLWRAVVASVVFLCNLLGIVFLALGGLLVWAGDRMTSQSVRKRLEDLPKLAEIKRQIPTDAAPMED